MDHFLVRNRAPVSPAETAENEDSPPIKKMKVPNRLYLDSYLAYGFSWTGDASCPQPVCVICREKLANASMVPSKLKRHLETKHSSLADRDLEYFKRTQQLNKRQEERLMNNVTVSDKVMEASYILAELIAKQKKPHTISETLILPACKRMAGVMLGQDAANALAKVPSSNDTIKRRITDMSGDIDQQITEKLLGSQFSLQIDKSTDISGAAQLLANVRFVDGDSIKENFLFCKELESHTTGEEIY